MNTRKDNDMSHKDEKTMKGDNSGLLRMIHGGCAQAAGSPSALLPSKMLLVIAFIDYKLFLNHFKCFFLPRSKGFRVDILEQGSVGICFFTLYLNKLSC